MTTCLTICRRNRIRLMGLAAVALAGLPGLHGAIPAASAQTSTTQAATPAQVAPRTADGTSKELDLGLKFGLEPKALEILKAASDKLAAARTLSFTAVATFESPARTGLPLAYTTLYRVTLERPNKLRVISPGDGPPSEFFYNGKTVMAFSPQADLVAVASAPPTIDEMLKAAFDVAAIYFPFTDLIVSDPYKDMSEGLKVAFFVGQSDVVGGVRTDIIVVANDTVQVQLWIGAEDKLPRMARAIYFDEPGQFRHDAVFSNWHLNAPVPADAFTSAKAAAARRMEFGAPADKVPQEPAPQPPATEGRKP